LISKSSSFIGKAADEWAMAAKMAELRDIRRSVPAAAKSVWLSKPSNSAPHSQPSQPLFYLAIQKSLPPV
jgi:hypothetical protein